MTSGHPSGKLIVVASYNAIGQYGGTQHFAYEREDRTLCGRDRTNWMIVGEFSGSDVDNAWSCKRCLNAL